MSWLLQIIDGCHQHLPLPFGNPHIHPCPFLRDQREVEPARTFNAERELPEMDLRLKRGQDYGVVTRFEVLISLDTVEKEYRNSRAMSAAALARPYVYAPEEVATSFCASLYSGVSIQIKTREKDASTHSTIRSPEDQTAVTFSGTSLGPCALSTTTDFCVVLLLPPTSAILELPVIHLRGDTFPSTPLPLEPAFSSGIRRCHCGFSMYVGCV